MYISIDLRLKEKKIYVFVASWKQADVALVALGGVVEGSARFRRL